MNNCEYTGDDTVGAQEKIRVEQSRIGAEVAYAMARASGLILKRCERVAEGQFNKLVFEFDAVGNAFLVTDK